MPETWFQRDEIVKAARSFRGTPFVSQGRSPHGCDCSGLVLVTLRKLRMDIEELWARVAQSEQRPVMADERRYPMFPDPQLVRGFLEYIAVPINPDQMKIADLVLMQYAHSATYCAIVTEVVDPHIIAAFFASRAVAERRLTRALRSRIKGAYQLRGVND